MSDITRLHIQNHWKCNHYLLTGWDEQERMWIESELEINSLDRMGSPHSAYCSHTNSINRNQSHEMCQPAMDVTKFPNHKIKSMNAAMCTYVLFSFHFSQHCFDIKTTNRCKHWEDINYVCTKTTTLCICQSWRLIKVYLEYGTFQIVSNRSFWATFWCTHVIWTLDQGHTHFQWKIINKLLTTLLVHDNECIQPNAAQLFLLFWMQIIGDEHRTQRHWSLHKRINICGEQFLR